MPDMSASIRYKFTQSFDVPAEQAYLWCTDFRPQDHQLMRHGNADREVIHVSDDVVILQEVFHTPKGDLEKQKLVHLYPDILSWVSTHVSGSNKYSQFRYHIIPKLDGSRLEYEALHVEHSNLTTAEVEPLSERLCREDAEAWRLLATAMTKDFIKQV
jgi:hypothetical protein